MPLPNWMQECPEGPGAVAFTAPRATRTGFRANDPGNPADRDQIWVRFVFAGRQLPVSRRGAPQARGARSLQPASPALAGLARVAGWPDVSAIAPHLAARLALALLCLLSAGAAWAESGRVALVVGNQAYPHIGPLENPAADARLVGDTLQALGFRVTRHQDLGLDAMTEALRAFGARARGAEVAVVYFSGHGLQLQRPGQPAAENYLLPVDARLRDPRDVPRQALALQDVLDELAGAGVAVVLLDACRDNPAAARVAGLGVRAVLRGGLAPVPDAALQGMVLGFATAPGATASDGPGRNGPYAATLALRLRAPGEDIGQVLRRVRADVWEATRDQPVPQLPEFVDRRTTGENLFLAGPLTAPQPAPPLPPVPSLTAAASAPPQAAAPPQADPAATPGLAPAHDCDRLAQPSRTVMGQVPSYAEGVDQGRMDGRAAATACRRAMAAYPDEARFVAYAARAASSMGDGAEAVQLYRLAADRGNAVAQNDLGYMYLQGQGGLAQDEREVVRLYHLAAGQGYASAQANLGWMYEVGRGGLTQDDHEAVRLYRLAAGQGNARGQVNLGTMYARGRGGLAWDDTEAVRLYRLAADQGDAWAQDRLGWMYEQGRGGLAQDEHEAIRLYRLAAGRNKEARASLRRLGQ